jgi:hypothetical protein
MLISWFFKICSFIFSLYRYLERAAGDRDKVEHVKARAMEYVSSKFG